MRRDISIITERRHLSPQETYFKLSGALYNKAERITATARAIMKDRYNKQWNAFQCITGERLRRVANKARQRKKGPIVRFGGRVY